MPQFIPAQAAAGGGGGGWTDFVELTTSDDNLTLTSGDNGTIVKCVTYYVFEENNNSHNIYLPPAEVGLQFAFYVSLPDVQSNITVIADGSDVIVNFDYDSYSIVTLNGIANYMLVSFFVAITGGWIIVNPITTWVDDNYVYWQTIIPEPG